MSRLSTQVERMKSAIPADDEQADAWCREFSALQCKLREHPVTTKREALIYLREAQADVEFGELADAPKDAGQMIAEAIRWLEAR